VQAFAKKSHKSPRAAGGESQQIFVYAFLANGRRRLCEHLQHDFCSSAFMRSKEGGDIISSKAGWTQFVDHGDCSLILRPLSPHHLTLPIEEYIKSSIDHCKPLSSMPKKNHQRIPLKRPSRPPLLSTESPEDFEVLRCAMRQPLSPNNAFEGGLSDDVALGRFRIATYERAKAASIERKMAEAVANLMLQLVRGKEEWEVDTEEDAAALGELWREDPSTKARIKLLLEELNLGDAAIEAEATILAADEVAAFDKLIDREHRRARRALQDLSFFRNLIVSHQSGERDGNNGDGKK
jgi:hypothetical protein